MRVDFYFDPICPWCWITARWLVEVAPHRYLDVSWRSFSLAIKNRDRDVPERFARSHREGLRALRVAEAVREAHGEGSVAALYEESGRHYQHDRNREFDHAAILEAVSLPTDLAAAADDQEWDVVIERSMDDALAVAGDEVGVPLIVFDGEYGTHGPIVSRAPTGAAALDLFDRVVDLTTMPGFFELKRSRTAGPEFGPRP